MTRSAYFLCVIHIAVLLLFISMPASGQDPSVSAGGKAFPNAAGNVFETTPPLVATYLDTVGENVGFGEARPGRLRASAKIVNGIQPFDQSTGTSAWRDYIDKSNLLLADNGTGTFVHRFVLSGVMRIRQDASASAGVNVVGYGPAFQDAIAGYLEMGQSGNQAILFGTTGGTHPFNNIFAAEDGSMRIWGVASTAVDGYFTIQVRIPVRFTFTQFRYNPVPPGPSVFNSVQVEMGAYAFKNAEADFASTFNYETQNPIVPDTTNPNLPATGWTYAAASNDITLPSPLSVPTATGTGDAAFSTELGTIENLEAIDEALLPTLKPEGGDFPHGFFSFDVTGVDTAAIIDLTTVMPLAVAPSTQWWFHSPAAGWSTLPASATAGTGQLVMVAADGAEEDLDATDGVLRLLGGPGQVEVIFANSFESPAR
ncbi:MAG: hypothetical protein QNJ40_05885 [Xanthomonadales bacterium]|nr:hypothetical protein [Xanthomonadales bacterium]